MFSSSRIWFRIYQVKNHYQEISTEFKLQIMMELLQGEGTVGQLAKSCNVHPNSILKWKKELLEEGPEIFTRDSSGAEYAAQIAQLEQLSGEKEVWITFV